jgi:hypothetical protein
VRAIAFAVPALVACGFFLYVLIAFQRDEKRPRKSGDSEEPNRTVRGVVKFPEARKKGAAAVARKKASRGLPYVEATFPVALIVAPMAEPDDDTKTDRPPRRIA